MLAFFKRHTFATGAGAVGLLYGALKRYDNTESDKIKDTFFPQAKKVCLSSLSLTVAVSLWADLCLCVSLCGSCRSSQWR